MVGEMKLLVKIADAENAAATVAMSVATWPKLDNSKFPPPFPGADHVHPVTWVRSADQGSADNFIFRPRRHVLFVHFCLPCHRRWSMPLSPSPRVCRVWQVLFWPSGLLFVFEINSRNHARLCPNSTLQALLECTR